ncbi:MAG: protein TolQ [Myxococcota bacterium]|nr:protein TolQ [Myxococcota bacterium]
MDNVVTAYLAAVAVPAAAEPSALDLVLDADLIVQFVLLSLVAMSVIGWVIIVNKGLLLRQAARQSAEFQELFWNSRRLDQVYEKVGSYPQSPLAQTFKAGYVELHKLTQQDGDSVGQMDLGGIDNLTRALRRASSTELTNLERLIPFLATTGSTAPFIGLFGTVWGILRAFQKIGASGSASIAVVGPDIAHALIATAVGLAAAIPAVMAYNFFNSRIRVLATEMDNFSADFLNIVKRHFSKGRGRS